MCHQGPMRLLHRQHSLHTGHARAHRAHLPHLVPKLTSQGPGEISAHTQTCTPIHTHTHGRRGGVARVASAPRLVPALPTLGAQVGSRASLWGSVILRLQACRGVWGAGEGTGRCLLGPAASRLLFSMCTKSSKVVCQVDKGKLPTPRRSSWTHLGPGWVQPPVLPSLAPPKVRVAALSPCQLG